MSEQTGEDVPQVRKRKRPPETPAEKLAQWQRGVDGFLQWIRDVRPRVPSDKDGFEELRLTPELEAEIREMFSGRYRVVVACWPRRHGKTLLLALYVIWRFTVRKTQTIGLVANSATQSIDTSFKLCSTILRETPFLKKMVNQGIIRILGTSIQYDLAQNEIIGYPSNVTALHGKKLSIAQVSELHASNSQAVLDTFMSATADTADGILLIDSTTGPKLSPLFALYNLAQGNVELAEGEEPLAIYFSHVFYTDYADLMARKPAWIDGRTVNIIRRNSPFSFNQEWLNKWSDAQSALFRDHVIEKCSAKEYELDPKAICGEASYVVSGGLDRSFGGSLHGDATVTTCVLKTLVNDEEHFWVLDSDVVRWSGAYGINKNFERYRTDYGMSRLAIEAYNSQDIYDLWAGKPEVHAELIHANVKEQNNCFPSLYYAAAEGRLHVHPKFKRLLKEMGTFEYTSEIGQHRSYHSFGHAKGCHDDTIYSLAWAVHALRSVTLNPYTINGIVCDAPIPVARLCILNGGDLVPMCSAECRSFTMVSKLFKSFAAISNNDDVNVQFFVKNKLINTGPHTTNR